MTKLRFILRLSSLLLFCALLPGLPQHAEAQTKVAYLDASKLLKRMPEAKDAETRIGQLVGTWTREANTMQSEIDRKQSDYDRRKLIMTDAERNATELDLTTLRKRLDEYRHSKFDENGGELFSQQQQLMKPAYDKLANAIKEIAAELGFDYVIDRSSRDVVLLYTNSKYDLTIPVARKLGIENELLSTPLIQQGKPGAPATPPGTQPATPPGMQPGTTPGTPVPGQNPLPNPQAPGMPQQPTQPGFNTGGYNPGQTPPPPGKH
ncbi:MAG: OmpH family outer membrane protein [Bacteroidota bacterium]|nr:OmpH family outer membrane protein [Bacteroidota bacterium]MDP4233530.1 OmpH family outer membrane protein [Bacteroidota bacterium]MDP4244045.1 OmpH family outer membrane protein [Bacteroidota bacterium]MDP4287716.1 OmpH family outer membrane protein [Bacteroidota bacterium]